MIAVDVAVLGLTIGLLGLLAFTVAIVTGLTSADFRRRARPAQPVHVPPTPTDHLPPTLARRVITGRPIELPPVATASSAPGVLPSAAAGDAARAEQTIRQLLDEHPETVVRMISEWLAEDPSRAEPRSAP